MASCSTYFIPTPFPALAALIYIIKMRCVKGAFPFCVALLPLGVPAHGIRGWSLLCSVIRAVICSLGCTQVQSAFTVSGMGAGKGGVPYLAALIYDLSL